MCSLHACGYLETGSRVQHLETLTFVGKCHVSGPVGELQEEMWSIVLKSRVEKGCKALF